MPGMKGPGGRPNARQMQIQKPKNAGNTIRRILAYLKNDKGFLILALICVLFNTLATLAGSYLLRPVINNLVDAPSVSAGLTGLLKGLALMAAVYAVGVICNYGQSRIMVGVSQRALYNLRRDLFVKVQRLPVRFYDTNNTGDIMSRFTNDVDAIGEMLNNTVIQLVSGFMSIIGTLALMLYTNILLSMIVIVMIPLIIKVGGAIAKRSRRYYSAQQAAIGRVNGYIEEMVTGSKVVKVFCHEEQTTMEFQKINEDLRDKQIRAQFLGGVMGPVMNSSSQIIYVLVASIGGILCVTRGFDVGGLTIFLNFSRQFSRPINEVSMQMNTIFSALAGAERVFAVMDEAPEEPDREDAVDVPSIRGEVVFDHVTFGYHPDKIILKDISLYAHPGQKIAFVGSTGAGKTTITNLINRFYDIQQGTITIDDIDIKKYHRSFLRENVAMVLQDTHLFTGTVMENIRYGRLDATNKEVIDAAKLASAHSFIKRLPLGYQTMIHGDGSNLSQGQRQLLNIARAAVSNAPIIILDEATSSVDTRTERHIEHGMDRLMKNRTTFIIAHRLSTVRNSNAIMVLEHGEIIERGTHEDLLAMKGRYYDLYTGATELA